jgi:hypothetical protein
MPTDEHGEYEEDRGEPHPIDPDEVQYEPCNAVLKYTFERYGERRYCGGMAVSTFESSGTETSYDNPQFCKHHQAREELMKTHEDNFKTGAYASSHEHKFQYLPPHKQIIANDLYGSLIRESSEVQYEDCETVPLTIDVAEHDFAPDYDEIEMDHPLPENQSTRVRAKALWHAALDFVTMESIREEQFRVAAEETGPEGEPLAIGESTEVVTVTDDGREIEDSTEHHLNIALSRIQKDYQRHLEFGGVTYEGGDDSGTSMSQREWVAFVEPEESEPEPEVTASDTSPLADVAPDDFEAEDD